jgi:hypothetical protein
VLIKSTYKILGDFQGAHQKVKIWAARGHAYQVWALYFYLQIRLAQDKNWDRCGEHVAMHTQHEPKSNPGLSTTSIHVSTHMFTCQVVEIKEPSPQTHTTWGNKNCQDKTIDFKLCTRDFIHDNLYTRLYTWDFRCDTLDTRLCTRNFTYDTLYIWFYTWYFVHAICQCVHSGGI